MASRAIQKEKHMTEDAGNEETLAQRLRKRIAQDRQEEKAINQPPAAPISPSDQELIDRLSERVVGIAHDMVERLGANKPLNSFEEQIVEKPEKN